jgi:predicted dehydrogenase
VKNVIRYGITGSGYIGAAQARIIDAMPGAQLIAVHSGTGVGARRIADQLGCQVEDTLGGLITRPDVDAVIVASPNDVHRKPVVLAAEHGKHVFCEKPFALSLEDADAMLATCREAGVTLMVGHMMHFYSGVLRLKEWIDAGRIGRPLVAHVERTGWEDSQPKVSWKKQQSHSGGHLFHHIHEIDLLQWLIGPATRAFAAGGNLVHQASGHGDEDDVILLTLELEDGALATMQYGSAFHLGEHFLKIGGSEGAVLMSHKEAYIELIRPGEPRQRLPLFDDPDSQSSLLDLFKRTHGGSTYGRPTDNPPLYLCRALVDELTCFNDALCGAGIDPLRKPLFDGSAARAAVAVAETGLLSMRQGVPLPVPQGGSR